MEALYMWLADDLNQGLINFCRNHEEKKCRVVRTALTQYLESNGVFINGTAEIESAGVEDNASTSANREQPAS